jgi:predicted lipase
MTSKIATHPADSPFHAIVFGVVACTGIALAISSASAFAVEQCRFIQAKIERETCYQRQEAELAARRKRTEEPRRDKTMESLEQMKHEDEALNRQIHGICRGC